MDLSFPKSTTLSTLLDLPEKNPPASPPELRNSPYDTSLKLDSGKVIPPELLKQILMNPGQIFEIGPDKLKVHYEEEYGSIRFALNSGSYVSVKISPDKLSVVEINSTGRKLTYLEAEEIKKNGGFTPALFEKLSFISHSDAMRIDNERNRNFPLIKQRL